MGGGRNDSVQRSADRLALRAVSVGSGANGIIGLDSWFP
jgi:hypothetical protein